MAGKRGVYVAGYSVSIPSDQYEMLDLLGWIKNVDGKRVVSADNVDPVTALYAAANDERQDWKLWIAVPGTAEGQLTYAAKRPTLVIPLPSGSYDALEFIVGVTAQPQPLPKPFSLGG